MCCEDRFVRELRERGLRLTPQREAVLRVLHSMEQATAEGLHARVVETDPDVDLSTVYRTLDLLQTLEFVACFDRGDGQRWYELLSVQRPHHHLLCRSCGTMTTIEVSELSPLLRAMESVHGFQARMEHSVIPGLCHECQAEGRVESPDHRRRAAR